ncbi:MAG: FHA domain-containing protein [Pirellulales bacterium]
MPRSFSGTTTGTSLLGDVAGDFLLRITAGPQAGRMVRLSSAKCTVGSAPYCTLRLHGPEVQPVHCVILHGKNRSVVRRWSGSTLLNDRTFEDMPLAAGDRLSVGPVEFQVVELPGKLREAADAMRRANKELNYDRSALSGLTNRLELANRQGRRRLRAAVAKLRKYQMRLAEMEGRRRLQTEELAQLQLERGRIEALDRDVQSRRAECESRRLTLAAEEKLLLEQAERMRTLAKQASHDREAAQDAWEAKRAELAKAEADVQARVAGTANEEERLRAEAERLRKLEAEISRRTTELEAQAQVHADRMARDAARLCDLETREASLNRALAELEKSRSELTARTAELGAQAAELKVREAGISKGAAQHSSSLVEREQMLTAREAEQARSLAQT